VKAGTVVSVQQPDQHNGPIDLSSLTRADLAAFSRLGISPELLAQAHVERVSDCEAREYGITGPVLATCPALYSRISASRLGPALRHEFAATNSTWKQAKKRTSTFAPTGAANTFIFHLAPLSPAEITSRLGVCAGRRR
jgi:hypothetical protein